MILFRYSSTWFGDHFFHQACLVKDDKNMSPTLHWQNIFTTNILLWNCPCSAHVQLVGRTLLLYCTFKLTLSGYLNLFLCILISQLFMMLCIVICYKYSTISDNKHELIQVIVAANVTTHKSSENRLANWHSQKNIYLSMSFTDAYISNMICGGELLKLHWQNIFAIFMPV